ncbi:MAG: RraA family protein [Candidatus Curtissbacteria bacterium]
MDDLSDRLLRCYSGAVYDVMRNMGHYSNVLHESIRPINNQHKIAGKIFTIEGKIDKTLDKHTSLLKWCEMLSAAPPETVLVCQPNDHSLAYMGELSAETLAFKKVRGYIVDGGCRDSEFIDRIGWPVFCRYFTPRDIVSSWAVTELGNMIEINGVKIHTNDYVLADRDGIVIIPGGIINEVVEETEKVLKTENLVRKSILEGVDPVEAYLKYGKF